MGNREGGRFGVSGEAASEGNRGYANCPSSESGELANPNLADSENDHGRRRELGKKTRVRSQAKRRRRSPGCGEPLAYAGGSSVRSEPITKGKGKAAKAKGLEECGPKQSERERRRVWLESGRGHVPARNELDQWRELLRDKPELVPSVTRTAEAQLGIRFSAHGLSRRLALRALGNALDPWQVLPILEGIAELEGIKP